MGKKMVKDVPTRKQVRRAAMRLARCHFLRKHGRARIETIQRCMGGHEFRCRLRGGAFDRVGVNVARAEYEALQHLRGPW